MPVRSLLVLGALCTPALTGCLLAAETPPLTDRCVNGDLGEALGVDLAAGRVAESDDTIECEADDYLSRPDLVFQWRAPGTGWYRFSVDSDGGWARVGLAELMCGGVTDACEQAASEGGTAAIEAFFQEGELVAVVVEDANVRTEELYTRRTRTSALMRLSVEFVGDSGDQSGPGGPATAPEPCPWVDDGVCDEPEGLDVCEEGSDVADCS